MRRIGIIGGSFNPVHIGHTALANYMATMTDLDEVWLSLSPLNPFKVGHEIASDAHRLEMLKIATEGSEIVRSCDVELAMPRPSYTINTLRHLASRHPDCSFKLIIGSDNWADFDRWRDYESIISEFGVIIYPRQGYPIDPDTLPEGVATVNAPVIEISSTFIRDAIADGHDVAFFMPNGVFQYIKANHLYEK